MTTRFDKPWAPGLRVRIKDDEMRSKRMREVGLFPFEKYAGKTGTLQRPNTDLITVEAWGVAWASVVEIDDFVDTDPWVERIIPNPCLEQLPDS